MTRLGNEQTGFDSLQEQIIFCTTTSKSTLVATSRIPRREWRCFLRV